jgi:hypothetical protein
MEVISLSARNVLESSEVGSNYIQLPQGQLDREVYEEVNEVIKRLGGKWKKGGKYPDGSPKGKHEFMFEVPDIFKSIIESQIMPPKNPTAFFPTPKEVIDKMIQWSEIETIYGDPRVLEPSAGMGAIAERIRQEMPHSKLDCVEFLDINARALKAKGFNVFHQDFMEFKPDYKYNLILMNPPFSLEKDKDAYISHINHAWDLLDKFGVLVAIVPKGYEFKQGKIYEDFNTLIDLYGEDSQLPEGSFKKSGTGVQTNIVYLKKINIEELEQEWNGWPCYYSWHFELVVENDREYENLRMELMNKLEKEAMFDMFGTPDDKTNKLIDEFITEVIKRSRKEGVRIPMSEKGRVNTKKCIINYFNNIE